MSHGFAGRHCNPLKQEGNACNKLRQGKGPGRKVKSLFFLAVPTGASPTSNFKGFRLQTLLFAHSALKGFFRAVTNSRASVSASIAAPRGGRRRPGHCRIREPPPVARAAAARGAPANDPSSAVPAACRGPEPYFAPWPKGKRVPPTTATHRGRFVRLI